MGNIPRKLENAPTPVGPDWPNKSPESGVIAEAVNRALRPNSTSNAGRPNQIRPAILTRSISGGGLQIPTYRLERASLRIPLSAWAEYITEADTLSPPTLPGGPIPEAPDRWPASLLLR